MSQNFPSQLIQTSNAPRLKIGGGRLGGIDPQAIAKAEAALRSLSNNFAQWLQDEIAKLEAARRGVATLGVNDETMEALYFRAHDLKGLGATYGFPLVTQIAGSMCKLIDDSQKRVKAPIAVVDAHIIAIKTVVQDGIKTDDDPAGRRLMDDLEEMTRDAG